MQPDLQHLPTASLLHRTLRESHRYWAERSQNEEQRYALVRQVRELLLRPWQKKCAFAHDRLPRPFCSYRDRLETMGCAHPEVHEGEGPEILSAVGFALRDLGLMSDEDRIAAATVVMESRGVLQELDYAAQHGQELSVLSEGQSAAMMRKEAVRQDILRRIAVFLQENV